MSNDETPVGRVCALYRFPVKSTVGQALKSAEITAAGLRHDRCWAVYTDDGGIASGKRTRRFRPVIGLMQWASSADEDKDVPVLVDPEGFQYRVDDPAAGRALSAAFGQELTLRPETTIPHHDESPLHVLTTSSLAALGATVGATVDHRRFRANIVIDTGVEPRFLEDDWIGADLAVGEDVVLRLGPGMPRCAMVDQDQAGVAAESPVLKSLGAHHGAQLGLQARAQGIGTIGIGDVVTLRSAMSH